jgi:hypothetical protein
MIGVQTRLRLVDLFRLICVFYIVIFHAWMIFIGENHADADLFPFLHGVEMSFPFLAFHSGLFIVAISFFLFGFNERKLPFWRWPLFLVGITLTQFNGDMETTPFALSSWKWGVFSFLMAAYLLLWLSQKMRFQKQIVFLFSFSLLYLVQTYQVSALYSDATPFLLKQALTGELIDRHMWTGWFLIPWIAYPLSFAGFGLLARKHQAWLQRPHLGMDLILPIALVASLWNYISTSPTLEIGPGFDAGIFHKDFWDILPILLFPILILRYSLLEKIQRALAGKFFGFISNLSWNRHFWLCYLAHLMFLFGLSVSPWGHFYKQSPAIEVAIASAYILPEIYVRMAVPSARIWKLWYQKWTSR